MPITIGISKGHGSPKYSNYANWIAGAEADIYTIDLAVEEDLDAALGRIDGLILTGGSDVDPRRYGHEEYAPKCFDVDVERDGREFRMMEVAEERDLPILAICRGLQVFNVYQGGTLIPHVPDVVGSEAHAKDGDHDRTHEISITPGSLAFKATRELSGVVNSAHHQSIDRLGVGLVATGRAEDGIVEVIEWANPEGKGYMLGVQWHPERMEDTSSPFSVGIREQFLFEVRSAQILSRSTRPLPKENVEPPPMPEDPGQLGSDPLFPIIQP